MAGPTTGPTRAEDGADARSDRRTLLVALTVMLGLVLLGVGFGSGFAGTRCRDLRVSDVPPPVAVDAADPVALADALAAVGLDTPTLTALSDLLGAPGAAFRLDAGTYVRIGAHPEGVVLTGASAVLVTDGGASVTAGVREAATFVGDGIAVYALVVGNTITGQVDALRPFRLLSTGLEAGTCVDTSAVGSPLSFLHDARDGLMLGLRTDEDGTDAVFELRDQVRGRIWAPPVTVGLAPAGLLGARTSAAIGPDRVVLARRFVDPATTAAPAAARAEEDPVVRIYDRRDGALVGIVTPGEVREALAAVPTLAGLATLPALRLEVAWVDAEQAVIEVRADVGPADPLPPPRHGPFAGRDQVVGPGVDPGSAAVVTVDLASAGVGAVVAGDAPRSRAGAEAAALLDAVQARAPSVIDARRVPGPGSSAGGGTSRTGVTWVLLDGLLLRFGP